MAQWKWWSWRILGRTKRKGVDLRLNAAIEIAPLNSLNVHKRFSFLLRLQQSFIAINLETNYFDRKETSKNSKICRLLAKIFARWGRKQWLRSNVCAQKSSKHWLSRLSSLQVLSTKTSPLNWSWMIWSAIFILLLLFICEVMLTNDNLLCTFYDNLSYSFIVFSMK
ncbi:hypothetical protein MA16_Dca016539 [Dendrobium catenatum]|uniref:Uncharacterized protein n=2 Tax=Dendrobium catenatum TaxID=906689 RepID=A0A2I0WNM7_9ASPA|nr:hypothetical protein MA16_Dca016539 [Dendrobium catenatum]